MTTDTRRTKPRSHASHLTHHSRGTSNGRQTQLVIDTVFRDLDRLCQDLGLTHRALARRARLDPGFVGHLFERRRDPSGATLVALCEAVGSDLSIRLFPRPGTPIFDRSQALIVEALIALSAGTATAFPEVHTRRPARGFIDLVLDRTRSDLIACEVQSRIDRLEQHLRWLTEKAESLPSSEIWAQLGGERAISRLLVLRSTVATRALAVRFESTLSRAYPATCAAIHAALFDPSIPWPGAGILWADVRGDAAKIMAQPPRGVSLGR